MKKLTILGVVALLWLSFSAKAQDTTLTYLNINDSPLKSKGMAKVSTLTVGDRLPEAFWAADRLLLNGGNAIATNLKHLKGQALLLDFWATWCSSCLNEFPKMNLIQQQFGKNFNILLVNTSSQDTPQALASFQQKQDAPFVLRMVVKDQKMQEMFPITSMPHYIWIAGDGRIKAITGAEEVTATQIKKLIAGLDLDLKVKEN